MMNFIKKWYTYQKERFPVLTYGIYILAIVFAVFCFNNYLAPATYEKILKEIRSVGPEQYTINYYKIIPMFIVAFLQFLMIRIIDEFKDYEEDCKYRPYRPVPRGLITLKELKVLFVICGILQLIITFLVNTKGLILLLAVWLFFAIMSKGFFIKKFLDKHLLIEVFLDELLMPILVLYLSSYVYYIDYSNIWKILAMSYIISWIVEVARKVRCKEDEENGVRTYTAVFGIKKAVLILFVLETLLMIIQTVILGKTYIGIIIGIYIIANLINLLFTIKQNRKFAKLTELSANMYILIVYFSLGLLIL
jgi:4-hydroxybenzoate polyprenyltransferase